MTRISEATALPSAFTPRASSQVFAAGLRPTALAVHLACAVLAGAWTFTPVAYAQATGANAAVQADVPAGALADALNGFALQAGVAIVVDADLLKGRTTPGLKGAVTVEEGFRRLLDGSGYRVEQTAAGYVLARSADRDGAVTLAPVNVTTAVESGVTQNLDTEVRVGALGDIAQKDTPFSSFVLTSNQIQAMAPRKLGDLFIQDASVSDNSGAYTPWSTYLTVRGMDLDWQNSYRIDGKPFLGYTVTLPYEHMEQIELLKGATGFMYGFGAPGGMLNYVTKKPSAAPIRSVSLGYASSSIVRVNADLGDRLGETDALGYRLDLTHEEGTTPNDGSLRRSSFLLALDARLTDRLTWDFQGIYQDRLTEDAEPVITTRLLGNRLPGTIRNDDTLVGPGTYVDNQFGFVATGLKYDLGDDWQARTSFSQSYSKTRRNESILNLQNVAGDYRDDRADYGERYLYSYWDAMLQGRTEIAGMTHHIVAGISWQKQRNDDSSNSVYIPGYGTGNLDRQNTNRYDSIGSFGSLGLYRLTELTQKSVFASDRIELTDRWSVLAGLRWSRYEKLNWDSAGNSTAPYKENGIVTPTVALMYKAASDTMVYASYVESLQQGAIVPSLPIYTNEGETLDPLMSEQWEVGIKKDGETWSATAAVFRVTKSTEYDRGCGADCLTRLQSGESVFQGVELGATSRLSDAWSLGGNLMLLDAEYASGEEDIEGNRVAGAPRLVATAQLAYRVPMIDGLQLQLSAKHTGKTPLRADDSVDLEGYTLASFSASYDTVVAGRATTFRAAIDNLFDNEYWLYQYSNYIKAGDPRTFNLSATLNF